MKLHLPKLLLTAVLAACVTPSAWAGWGTDTEANTFYYTGSETSLNTSDSSGDITYLKPNGATSGTIGTVTIAENDKLIITGKWNSTAASDNFSGLTISSVVGDANRVLEIGAHQSSDDSIIGNQTVTINNGKETYGVAHTIVNTGATLNFSSTIDAINHTKTMVMDVSGTVDFGTARQTVGNFTLNLISGTITGSNTVGSADGDHYGAIDFKENITGKITSTGTSSITGGVRLRTGITIDVAEKSVLTIDAITHTGGITKTGSGTLTITLANTYNEGLYTGNTTLKDSGTIEYAVTGTTTYTGTISGSGNITMSGSGSMTLSKVSNLDGDISVTNGSLTITAMDVSKTMGVSVTQGKTLNINSVTVDSLNNKLDLISKTGEAYYTTDGTTQTSNGFKVETATYRLFDGYVWNGTVAGFTVGQQDGDTTLSTSGAGTIFYVNEGTHAISTAGDYINGRATGYVVNEGQTLKIDGNQSNDVTASDILKGAIGNGNVLLTTNAQLNGVKSAVSGNLTIGDGATQTKLIIGAAWNTNNNLANAANISSFSSVTLDKGVIDHNAAPGIINNLTVTSKGGEFNIYDQNIGSALQLKGTTTLNGDLSIATAWKYKINIEALTGSGNFTATAGGASGDDTATIEVGSLQGYTGAISMTKGAAATKIKMVTGGAVSLKGITLAGGAEGSITTTGDAGLGTVSLSGGSTLILDTVGITANGSQKNHSYTYTLNSLTVDGNAVIKSTQDTGGWQSNVVISSLSNASGQTSGVLKIESNNKTERRSVVNLNGGSFSGQIELVGSAEGAKRKVAMNLNTNTVAQNAEIKLSGRGTNTNGNEVALAIGADEVTVKGISSSIANGSTAKLNIVSGAQQYQATSSDPGGSSFASDGTDRTLHINTAGSSYTTAAVLGANINLKKSGNGTQTFTGSMDNFTGNINVIGGELVIANDVELAELSVAGGTMTVGTYTGGELTTEGSLTVTSKATFGAGATVNADLVLSSGATVKMAEALTMGSTVTLGEGMTLDGDLLTSVTGLAAGEKVNLFTGVEGLTLGSASYDTNSILELGTEQLGTYFANVTNTDIYLGYDGQNVFAGVKSPVTPAVPEPTTATLSLLALAALASRRRRK